MQKGQILIWIIVGALVMVIAGGAYIFGRSTSSKLSPTPVVSQTPQPTPAPSSSDETANWKTYTNKLLKVEFNYPSNFSFKEDSNRGTSATTIQDTVRFKFNDKEFVFEKISSDGNVPPYAQTNTTQVFNGITWKVLTPDKNAKYCDAGDCSGITPSYYLFKDSYQYSFYYYSDSLKQTIEQILSTFKFTQ